MIETVGGFEDVEAIAATQGVGMLFIGPYDLSLALQTNVSALLEEGTAIQRIVEAAKSNDIGVGGFAGSPAGARRMQELGVTCVAVADDSLIIAEGARAILEDLKY